MEKPRLENLDKLQLVRISTCGSVDDGKSTLIGRLLYECGGVFEDNLSSLRKIAKKNGSQEIDFSLLLDGLSAEREQKITIDVAYRFFTTPKRRFIIADVPGHEQYTRNMVTGISTADVAIVLVDASKGMSMQTKRHLSIASLLGVEHVLVVINKMDLVGYREEIFGNIKGSVKDFVEKLSISDLQFMPVSSLSGEMLNVRGSNFDWYKGLTLIDYLESVPVENNINPTGLRFPVQTVIKSSQNLRGYAGQVLGGRIIKGQKVYVYPGKKTTTVKDIFYDFESQAETFFPQSSVLTLADELDVSRGDMIVSEDGLPCIGKSFRAVIFWFSEEPLDLDRSYILKQTTKNVRAKIDRLSFKFDVNNAERQEAKTLAMNDIGWVDMTANSDLFFDTYNHNKNTGSFILIDDKNFNTVAAGSIARKINAEDADRKNKEGSVIWFTGLSGSGKSTLAEKILQNLEKRKLPAEWLDGDDFREKFNFDLNFSAQDRIRNIQRTVYVAKMLTKNGINVIGSFITPYEEQRKMLRESFKNYVEIFVDAPLAVCRERDVKSHYKKADLGEIKNFTGVGDIYERPENCEIHLHTDKDSIDECIGEISDYLEKSGMFR